jgi:hypothetical protein
LLPRRFKVGERSIEGGLCRKHENVIAAIERVIGAPEVESAIREPEVAYHKCGSAELDRTGTSLLPTPMSDGLDVMRRHGAALVFRRCR